MKMSNETKIGALTAVAITLLILGFNFLKGKNIFDGGNIIYAKYTDTKGLLPSNAVIINGYQVGSIYKIEEADKYLRSIVVAIKLKEDFKIPVNSVAAIKTNPLSSASIEIILGTSTQYLKNKDTVKTLGAEPGMFSDLTSRVGPVADQLEATLHSLDSLLKNTNAVLDASTRTNMRNLVANLNRSSINLATATTFLQTFLQPESGGIARTIGNLQSFTANLRNNQHHINNAMANLDKTAENFAAIDIKGTVNQLKTTVDKLDIAIAKLNSTEGSIGSLINDKQLYNNLNSTARSLNTLMDDIRVNPKRYVSLNFSLFGRKKSDENYLTAPLVDTVTSVQHNVQ